MTRASLKTWKPEGGLTTPYQKAGQEWDSRMGTARVQAKNWRLAFFSAMSLLVVETLGVFYLAAQPKVVPHIVEIDKIGAAYYRGPAGVSAKNYAVTDATIKYHLTRFVLATRTLSSDTAVVKANWLDAYSLTTPVAHNLLTKYATDTNPIKRSIDGERVGVQVLSMVRRSHDTWQVDWKESHFDKQGGLVATELWRGMFRVVLRLPQTEEQLIKNPIGLYVDELDWSKVQGS